MNDHTYLLDLSYDGNLRYFDMSNKNALVWKSNSKPGFGPFTSSVSDTGLFGIYDSDNKLVWSYQWFDKTQIVWKTSDNGDWAIKCDSPGDDLQTVKSNSPQDCQTQCFNTGRCNSWALIGDTCYLKFKLNASRDTFKPASKTDYCGLVKLKILWNSSPEGDWGDNCDWPGNDNALISTKTLQECQQKCNADSICNAWAFFGSNCYLKTKPSPSRSTFEARVGGIACGMVKPKILWRSSPEGDWGEYCDWPGDDLKTINSNSPQDCQKQCFGDDGCNSWALVGSTCYFKKKSNPVREKFSIRSSLQYCGMVKSKILWNASPEGDWGEYCDWPGDDYKTTNSNSPQDCQRQCFGDGNCNSWALVGNTCYFKIKSSPARGKFEVRSSLQYCGMVKAKILWHSSQDGDWGEYCDAPGDDYKTTNSNSPQDCQRQCYEDVRNCNTWALLGNTCYFKVKSNPSRATFEPRTYQEYCGVVKPKLYWYTYGEGDWAYNCDDLDHNDLRYIKPMGKSADCAPACNSDPQCTHWTWTGDATCYLKRRNNVSRASVSLITNPRLTLVCGVAKRYSL
ncbi:hypothetical protein BC833DRAFT_129384 [Globomyces pollinis-pini]|nr:hypothetical protein BC833DRAFT_129384 [Globomyces pollinis-pini]